MAVPVITTDLTMIDSADAGTSWTGWGVNSTKWDDEGDIYIEGGGSQGLQPSTAGDGGWGVELGASIDLSATGNRLFIWVYTTPGFIHTSGDYGVYVRICSDTGDWVTDYYDFVVGGSDVAWVGRGWHLIALDCSQTPTRTTGSTTLTNINRVGVGFTHTATASKSTVTAIDVMYRGTYVEVTGVASSSASHAFTAATKTITRGSGDFSADGFEVGDTIVIAGTVSNNGEFTTVTVGTTTMTVSETVVDESTVTSTIDAYVGIEDIYTKDGPTDDDWYGIVTKNPLGLFEINYTLYLGDISGADNLYFRTRDEVIYFADQWMGANELSIITVEDTGTTVFEIGNSSGTGDNRVGFSGSIITHANIFHGVDSYVNLDDAITDCFVYGATFLNIGGGVNFAADATHRAFNTTFSACGQIDLASIEARNLVFAGYTSDTDGALLWNASINIKSSAFLANTDGTNDPHAIEHPASGTFGYVDLTFAGNDYDINFSAASGTLTINNVGTSNAGTYEITGGGSTVTIVTAYGLTITTVDKNNDPVANVSCAIYLAAGNIELLNEDSNALGVADDSTTYTGDVYWRVRESPAAGNRYKAKSGVGEIVTSFSVTVLMEPEPLA